MDTITHVPPGFRFHPTDEELVNYYLRKKISSRKIDLNVIREVDLYKIEPWDLQEICKIGDEEQHEWYFFSHKDKKYPTGIRTNRATTTGFWKATGRDKSVYLKHELIGMRKTLVFYKGRAPNGQKSSWIMHEYRLESDENGTLQEEGWVVCRAFKKRVLSIRKGNEFVHDPESPCWYDESMSIVPSIHESQWNMDQFHHIPYPYKRQNFHNQLQPYEPHLHLPHLQSPKVVDCIKNGGSLHSSIVSIHGKQVGSSTKIVQTVDEVIDWRILDKFVASQLSQDTSTGDNLPTHDKEEDHASISSSSQVRPY